MRHRYKRRSPRLTSAFGAVTGIVHGAGVLADAPSKTSPPTALSSVFETKVTGLGAIYCMPFGETPLRCLALFSSSTARFGRRGQVAYAMANEVLNKMAQQQARRHPHCRVVSFNFGPWAAGMVTPALSEIFRAEGIATIALDEGCAYVVDQLNQDPAEVEIVVLGAGSVLPTTLIPGDSAQDVAAQTSARSIDQVTTLLNPSSPDAEMAYQGQLSLQGHPILASHVLDGKAVVPVALMIEWLGHGALHMHPGLRFVGFEDLRVFKGLRLTDRRPIDFQVHIEAPEPVNGGYRVRAWLTSGNNGQRHRHSQAIIRLASALPSFQGHDIASPQTLSLPPYELSRAQFYETALFHGEGLQGIKRIEGCGDRDIVGVVGAAGSPSDWMQNPPRRKWLSDPLAIDCAFQMMILWCQKKHRVPSLPTSIETFSQYRAFPDTGTRIYVHVRRVESHRVIADVQWLDDRQNVVASMRGYECVMDASLHAAFERNLPVDGVLRHGMSVPSPEAIAIVGIGGVFPGGPHLDDFWQLIVEGRSAIDDVPKERWGFAPDITRDAAMRPDSVRTQRAALVVPQEDLCEKLAEAVAIDLKLLRALDPQCHLALAAAVQAWRNANTSDLDRRRVSVVLGNIALPTDSTAQQSAWILRQRLNAPHLLPLDGNPPEPLNRWALSLPAAMVASGLELGGGYRCLDAACASSLFALKLAVDDLRHGHIDAVLTGGLSRPSSLYTQMGFSQLQALSPTGRCAPFDHRADGLVVGEGAGVVVLKRLSDAQRHGDHIYGLIRGIGLSNDVDGRLLAPSQEGQLRAMRTAYTQAGWQPSDVSLIECHATGTPVGDTIEFSSLCALRDGSHSDSPCVIGSVKSNVGHLLTGAGAASLIKVLLAMKHRTLPPTANFEEASQQVPLHDSPFRVLSQAEPWEATQAVHGARQ
ncbi:MAG: beta-ketoacyl synthase N-terminal-like domain-containing protein [Myxococcota bacterium]